jgi:hypothetical protein
MTPETLIAAIPEPVQAEIRAAYTHDPLNWFRRPSLRLWRMAMQRVLASRGFHTVDFVPTVERALNLR